MAQKKNLIFYLICWSVTFSIIYLPVEPPSYPLWSTIQCSLLWRVSSTKSDTTLETVKFNSIQATFPPKPNRMLIEEWYKVTKVRLAINSSLLLQIQFGHHDKYGENNLRGNCIPIKLISEQQVGSMLNTSSNRLASSHYLFSLSFHYLFSLAIIRSHTSNSTSGNKSIVQQSPYPQLIIPLDESQPYCHYWVESPLNKNPNALAFFT